MWLQYDVSSRDKTANLDWLRTEMESKMRRRRKEV